MSGTFGAAAVCIDLEAALLARGAVRRGRHLRFACVAHLDEHPSADFDPAQGVWVCRSCHVGGGARDLARRLGLTATDPPRPRTVPRVPRPPPGIARDDWAAAWTTIVEDARRQYRRLEPYREVFQIADWLRVRRRVVADARQMISALGPENGDAWALALTAARAETAAAAVEAELDALVRYVA